MFSFLKNLFDSSQERVHVKIENDTTQEEHNSIYLAKRAEEERRLNEVYDFNSIEGINHIPVPCHEVNGDSTTGRVEYYLRGKCFVTHRDAGREDIALACLKKAQELMYISDMIWKKEDFMFLVKYLHNIGMHEEATKEQKRIDSFFSKQDLHLDALKREISSANYLKTDLMEVYTPSPCCTECAKFTNRIYSLSGKDHRFPSFQSAYEECLHKMRCLRFSPFVLGVHEPQFKCKNIIKYSNRPFVDERTQDEKERYEIIKAERIEREKKAYQSEIAQQEYFWIQEHLPDLCPKSISGYSRMKKSNSKNYQKIVSEAMKLGKKL